MRRKGPHISIPSEQLLPATLGLRAEEFRRWPEDVRELAVDVAEELFLVRYNPFIDPNLVRSSVDTHFEQYRPALAQEYALALETGIRSFWTEFEEDARFKEEVIRSLQRVLPRECVDLRRNVLVEFSTDATDLRMELPMLVVAPRTAEHVRQVILLANQMGFAVVPQGGASGLTGGAVPARRRSVVLTLSAMTRIVSLDPDQLTLCAEAGVVTQDAIRAAAGKGMLFTVDPASKTASTLGGNIAENAGGPFAFEYGTTLDNLLSYRMVTPTGEFIEVLRHNHPRRKILSGDVAEFEILDQAGRVLETVRLDAEHIRGAGLGKDVTNKHLGGLPGVQKEGVDGVITEACFVCHPVQAHSRTLCLEFFGRTMHTAMLVIKDLVALRDLIQAEGDLVKMSALEEFNSKYVAAIEYQKKSGRYEGDPMSVLLVQLDSDDLPALEAAVARIVDIVEPYDDCAAFVARDAKEAELFWEDRHKLSAISKRTSGFKINEDVVIPIDSLPEFAGFLEQLNLVYMAKAYRTALQEVGRLPGVAMEDKLINREFTLASKIILGDPAAQGRLSDQELELQALYFFNDLKSRYPALTEDLDFIRERMAATRIIVASHMHAGDGNCHVNLPVNSNDLAMLAQAEEAAALVFQRVLELKGAVSGEHGIGITKIGFLDESRIAALKAYKEQVDPRGVLNPGKLTRRELPALPYTFSFNRLIHDLRRTGLPDKERLIELLQNIQICNRCGKCKQVCPMFNPQRSLQYHPRNKNISLGALIEAVYYTQVHKGAPDPSLLDELRRLTEHCTGCGKCTWVCAVKIDSANVSLSMRAFLEDKGSGGHPIKLAALGFLAKDPARRVPLAAKAASLGQNAQNKVLGLVPAAWRERIQNPLFSGPGPVPGFANLDEALHLKKGPLFAPADGPENGKAVLYFPGCGASVFYREIGLAALALLLETGTAVVLPAAHLCCGYPLLASGAEESFLRNQDRVADGIKDVLERAAGHGYEVGTVLTACGTCRDSLGRLAQLNQMRDGLSRMDVVQYLFERLPPAAQGPELLLYHPSCHAEWTGVNPAKAGDLYAAALGRHTGARVEQSPGCCGESGLGALSSPEIYNKLRSRKQGQLALDLETRGPDDPVLVGCPSCRIGVARSLMRLGKTNPVLHTLEYLARLRYGPDWAERIRKAAAAAQGPGPRRMRLP